MSVDSWRIDKKLLRITSLCTNNPIECHGSRSEQGIPDSVDVMKIGCVIRTSSKLEVIS